MNCLQKNLNRILICILVVEIISILLVVTAKSCTTEPADPIEEPEPTPVVFVEVYDRPEFHVPAAEPVKIRIQCPLDDDTQQMILNKCEHFEIDFAFVMALINQESTFRPDVISAGGDYGLMQINKCNHKWLRKELGITDFLDPEQNVTAGLYMLCQLFEKYDDPHSVLMAYNMGEGTAAKLWKKGIYTSQYSRSIMDQQEKYLNELKGE